MTRRLLTLVALLIGPVIGTARTSTDGVQVTPSSGTIDVPPYAQAQTQVFSVKNTGTRTVDFSIQATDCQPFELNCTWSTFSLNGVAPNQSVPLTTTFTSGAPGWSGTISFVAKVNDNQSVAAGATITVRVPQQAWVETKALNPGTTVARDHCVSFVVATNATYECGDLRIAHAAPSLRVRNDDRTPVLVYNSAHAEPRPVVLADVSTPNATSVTNVTATLTVRRGGNDVQVASQSFGTLPVASTQRVALTYDASGDTTGIYPYTMAVSMTVDGHVQSPISTSDTLVVVNRKTGPFGSGWWLAGYERLVPLSGGSFLWVGGDGSTRRYAPDSTNPGVYRTLGLERPDSLTLQGSTYVRMLRHRAQVQFDLSGRHVATVDPLNSATTFQHDGAGRLQFIIHPTASQPRHALYYSSGGLLDSLTGPGPVSGTRRITLLHGSGGRVERITDADGIPVNFGFGTPTGLVITSRTNRNGVTQTFGFASNRLIQATLPLTTTESAVSTFCPTEIRGLASGGCGGAPLPPTNAATTVDGPRSDITDVTTIKADRFGEPMLVTDPLGNSLRLYRGNRSMPALVTRVVNKNGWVNEAFYNANGLIGALVEYGPLGPGRDAVTSFQWDTKWERVTQITYPEQNIVQFQYDSTTGNRIWQQDGRGASSRTTFAYVTSGAAVNLLQTITYPADPANNFAVERFEYDATSGNLSASVSPLGTRTTYRRDAVGRDTSDVTPVDSGGAVTLVTRRTFDAVDQVTFEQSIAPSDTVTVATAFDGEGNPVSAQTTALPDQNSLGSMTRRYAYDLANRRLTDSVGTKQAASWAYDLAGNDTLVVRRGSMSVRTTFDALGRPVQWHALGRISLLSYDAAGNLVAADNPYAQVRRSYFPNGLLQTDSIRIATVDTTAANRWTAHAYGITNSYDLNGRRTVMSYPGQLMPSGTSGNTGYAYDAQSGTLRTVTDPFGNQYLYGYDALDRLRTYKAASLPADTFSYDLESRLTRRTRIAAGQAADVLAYDLRGKVLSDSGGGGATYLAIGPVKTLNVSSEGRSEQYITDGLGHRRRSSVLAGNQDGATVQWSVFEPVTARLLKTYPLPNNQRSDTTFYFYQVGGAHRETNAKHFIWKQEGGGCNTPACLNYTEIHNTLDDYDLEGHLATSTFTLDTLPGVKPLPPGYRPYKVYTSYRYDALGRRVWARTMRGTNCAAKRNSNAVCVSTVTRTVWDGAQILFEVRAPGDSLASAASMESDGNTSPKYGVVGYMHGLGIDQPLALFRGTQIVIPHATWRGVYERGSCLPSPCPTGLQFPGGNGSASVWGPTGVDPDKADWYGSLIWDQQDATGYQYKRNRYYDPGTGRFTQEDPAGLAGGLNLYGFAGGDPVNYSDPFGLCPQNKPLCHWIEATSMFIGSVGGFVGGGGGGALVALATGGVGIPAVPAGAWAGAGVGAAGGLAVGKTITNTLFSESAGGGGDPAQAARDWLGETNRANPGLNRTIAKWFKEGGELPGSITREYLENYLTAARDAIARNVDRVGVQAERVKMIEEALRNMR